MSTRVLFFSRRLRSVKKIHNAIAEADDRTETSFSASYPSSFQYLNATRRYESLSSTRRPPASGAKGFSPSPESYSRMKLYLADDIYDFQSRETLPTFILSLAELRFWRCCHHHHHRRHLLLPRLHPPFIDSSRSIRSFVSAVR